MHRMPAAAALTAVAMSAAVGCVALSPHAASPASDRSGYSRVTEPRMSPAPARESLGLVGPGGPDGSDGSRSPSAAESRTPSASGSEQDPDGDADPDRNTEAETRAEDAADSRSNSRPSSSRAADWDRWDGPGHSEARSPRAAPPARSAPGREPESAPAPPPPREAPPSRHHVEQAPPPPQRSESRPAQQAPPRSGSNLCALGETYGRWKKGDDASRICRQAYGH
ncbi:hypothetical protein [Streptomyces syringium]|uniref:hypothetical protein n=1 Tax=Streptomyces syringium TaxID=76729 RepID=UPI0037D0B317